MKHLLFILIVFLYATLRIEAQHSSLIQKDSVENYYWAQLGGGVIVLGTDINDKKVVGLCGRLGLFYSSSEHNLIYAVRAGGGGPIVFWETPLETYEEYGLMVGQRLVTDFLSLQYLGGVAYTPIRHHDLNYKVVGFVLEAGPCIDIKYVGLCATVFANINSINTVWGIAIELRVGLIR